MDMECAGWVRLSVIMIIVLNLFPNLATGVDTITSTQSLTKNQTIVSSGEIFELGFFSLGNSNKWYIGIWYKKIPTKTIVWVANRDTPLSSSSGALKIDKNDNNLILADESGKAIWQINGTSSSSNTVAQILDTGNFVVRREDDIDPGSYLWQSFDHPTDTLLPGMKLGLDKKAGLNRYLTSWKNTDDPSSGDYVFKINFNGFPEFFLWQNQLEVYRSGPWNGLRFSGVPDMGPNYSINFTFVMDNNEDVYSFKMTDTSKYSRLLVNSFGVLQRFVWIQTRKSWNVLWYAPSDQCDTYRQCGAFGVCDTIQSTLCRCMEGFMPKNIQEWSLRDGSEGCARKDKLNCWDDGFIRLKNVKLPETSNAVFNESTGLADCEKACQRNCSCTAYASMDIRSGGSGCMTWVGDLADLRQYSEAKGGQDLFVRVFKKDSGSTTPMGRAIEHLKTFLELWDLRVVILFSLLLQMLLIFLASFRKRVSSPILSIPMWLAYLLADSTATYALGIISKSQTRDPEGPFVDRNIPALWAPFLLVHLGGPDTITAFALEDNELWLRHLLNLLVHGGAVTYSFVQSFPNRVLWLPTLLMIIAGLIKYTERTRSLFLASSRRFRSSLLTKPDPGPNYAKLMDEYSSKIDAKLPTKIEMIPEPKRVQRTAPEVVLLSDLEIVQAAHDFFQKFKGLIADLIFSFRERTESRSFFLERNARDAFKVVEVELNFFYEILYTKFVVVNNIWGYALRFVSIGLTCASLVVFILFHKHEIELFDIGTTYTLLIGAIALDFIALIMALNSDWTAVMLAKKKCIFFNCFGSILGVCCDSWPAQKCFKKLRAILGRRWSGSISQYNLIHKCLNRRPEWLDKVIDWVGLTNMVDSIQYVKTEKIDDNIRDHIFEELKMKAEVADDLETSEEINSARGEWILRFHERYDLLPWVKDVDFDESLLLWHVATDLCYSYDDEGGDESIKEEEKNYRRFAKCLSDYMLYLLMMQSTMMSAVVGIGEIRFRDTCAEAKIFFDGRRIKKKQEEEQIPDQKHKGGICSCFSCLCTYYGKRKAAKKKKKREEEDEIPDETHKWACESLLLVHTAVKPVAVKGDRSKSVLFDACMLAKELKKLEGEKWKIMFKVWVELLSYAAVRCRAIKHAAELSNGGEFITIVWLLMTHFGLGNQFQISEGHARAKLIVGK